MTPALPSHYRAADGALLVFDIANECPPPHVQERQALTPPCPDALSKTWTSGWQSYVRIPIPVQLGCDIVFKALGLPLWPCHGPAMPCPCAEVVVALASSSTFLLLEKEEKGPVAAGRHQGRPFGSKSSVDGESTRNRLRASQGSHRSVAKRRRVASKRRNFEAEASVENAFSSSATVLKLAGYARGNGLLYVDRDASCCKLAAFVS